MTLRIDKNAGKGDRRRTTQDDNLYRNNYDLIFGKNKVQTEEVPDVPVEDNKPEGIYMFGVQVENSSVATPYIQSTTTSATTYD